jgi:hypothetical protein
MSFSVKKVLQKIKAASTLASGLRVGGHYQIYDNVQHFSFPATFRGRTASGNLEFYAPLARRKITVRCTTSKCALGNGHSVSFVKERVKERVKAAKKSLVKRTPKPKEKRVAKRRTVKK